MSKKIKLAVTECACSECRRACDHKPGWFRPGEPERAANLLGITLEEFFDRHLGVDWWVGSPDVFVLAPATKSMAPGAEYPANPKGSCVFFNGGKCEIHAAKPFECSHGNPHDNGDAYREAHKEARAHTVALWVKQQKHIADLLGREPQSEELSFIEAMFL